MSVSRYLRRKETDSQALSRRELPSTRCDVPPAVRRDEQVARDVAADHARRELEVRISDRAGKARVHEARELGVVPVSHAPVTVELVHARLGTQHRVRLERAVGQVRKLVDQPRNLGRTPRARARAFVGALDARRTRTLLRMGDEGGHWRWRKR